MSTPETKPVTLEIEGRTTAKIRGQADYTVIERGETGMFFVGSFRASSKAELTQFANRISEAAEQLEAADAELSEQPPKT